MGELFDDDDRHARTGDSRHIGVQLVDDDRCEAHRDLIEDQNRRVRHQPSGERQHLLLAARHRASRLIASFCKAREQLERLIFDAGRRGPAVARHQQILGHRQVGKDAAPFRDGAHTNPSQRVGGCAVDAPTGQQIVTRRRGHLTRHHRNGRGLTRPVRAQQHNRFAAEHLERNSMQNLNLSIGGPYGGEFQDRRVCLDFSEACGCQSVDRDLTIRRGHRWLSAVGRAHSAAPFVPR